MIRNETTHALNVCDTHTVTNERRRLQRLAYENPKLLGGVFCRRIFEPPSGMKKFRGRWTPRDTDIGTSVRSHFLVFMSTPSKIHTYHQKSTTINQQQTHQQRYNDGTLTLIYPLNLSLRAQMSCLRNLTTVASSNLP